jgi:HicB_like antitoxin of bacterial toxin-antitoxin system
MPLPTSEAIKRAGEALALHVEGMLADGKIIPEPAGLSPILAQPDYRTDVLALVPVQLPDSTTG